MGFIFILICNFFFLFLLLFFHLFSLLFVFLFNITFFHHFIHFLRQSIGKSQFRVILITSIIILLLLPHNPFPLLGIFLIVIIIIITSSNLNIGVVIVVVGMTIWENIFTIFDSKTFSLSHVIVLTFREKSNIINS